MRTFRISLGIVFVILGIIGSLLPVLQGWLFFAVALILFFPDHPRVARIIVWINQKSPRLGRLLRRLEIGLMQESVEVEERVQADPDSRI